MPAHPAAADLRDIPLDAIDPAALARDRTGLDAEPLDELRRSILTSGLRMPIELFERQGPAPDASGTKTPYGLISGYRRYTIFREFLDAGDTRYATIPAFVRDMRDGAEAFAAMVEENDIRADLSPWEKGFSAATAVDCGFFANIEDAVDRLYPNASKFKRSRIRTVARLAGEIGDLLSAQEAWSQQRLLRLADALRDGFAAPIRLALESTRGRNHASQWAAIQPLIEEYETEAADPPARDPRPGRPRRAVTLRRTLSVRRERTADGFVLRFSGREATSTLLDEVLDEIERTYNP